MDYLQACFRSIIENGWSMEGFHKGRIRVSQGDECVLS